MPLSTTSQQPQQQHPPASKDRAIPPWRTKSASPELKMFSSMLQDARNEQIRDQIKWSKPLPKRRHSWGPTSTNDKQSSLSSNWRDPSEEIPQQAKVLDATDALLKRMMAQYKTKTDEFTTWLVDAGQRCGHRPVNTKTNAEGHMQIPVLDFISLANAIADSKLPKMQVSSAMLTLLDDVIIIRTDYSDIVCRKSMNEERRRIDDEHRYFIGVLSEVRTILTSASAPPRSQISVLGKRRDTIGEPKG